VAGYPYSGSSKRFSVGRAYFTTITVVFFTILLATWSPVHHWFLMLAIAGFIIILELSSAMFSTSSLSLASAMVFASMIDFGTFQTSLSLALAMVFLVFRYRRSDPVAAAFNISLFGVSGAIGLAAYTFIGRAAGNHGAALIAYAVLYCCTSFVVAMFGLFLYSRNSWNEALKGNGFFLTSYVVEMTLGAAGGILYRSYGVVALTGAFVVAWLVLLAYKRSVDMTYAAETDDLTGLLNRRSFQQQITRTMRRENCAALLVIDLDHFKQVNDTSGHQSGDRVLQETAQIIQQAVGTSGIVSRYGGEEFCTLLCTDDAAVFAENLRKSIEYHQFSAPEKPQLTVSIGVATYPTDATEWVTLFACADRALYEAKQVRNVVREYSSLQSEGLQLRHTSADEPAIVS
jgi:diguanylate cyclase (GGDEF)-like protein